MSQGDKSTYTAKQKRQAKHIEKSELDSGRSKKDAKRIAWATVNKQDGGGKKAKAKSSAKSKAKTKTTSVKKKASAKSSAKKKSSSKSKK
jgi:hypothetical protein